MKTTSVLKLLVAALLPLAALSACAEIELASHAAKEIGNTGDPPPDGIYKVGKPYQIKGNWYYPKVDYDYKESGIASWYGPGFHGKPTANGETYDEMDLTAAHKTLPLPSMARVTNLDNGRSIVVRINDRGPFKRGRIIDVSRRAAQLLDFEQAGTAKVKVAILPDESRRLAAILQSRQEADQAPDPAPVVPVQEGEIGQPVPIAPSESIVLAEASVGQVESASDADPIWHAAPVPRPSGQVTVRPVSATQIYVQAGSFIRQDYATYMSNRLSVLGPTRVTQALVEERLFYRVRLGPLATIEDADKVLHTLEANGINDARVVVD
ncbi:MAG: septal ring lytic transglycosylase RlpA family protein [Pseudomonadota bacterium]